LAAITTVLIGGALITATGRKLVGEWLDSLCVQKALAVNLDFLLFADASGIRLS
jgi:hypothetical protein